MDNKPTYRELVHSVSDLEQKVSELTKYRDTSQTLQDQLWYASRLERLVTTISTSFINMHPKDIDREIIKTLQVVGEFAGVDRSYVFQLIEDRRYIANSHEWCSPGIEPHIQELSRISVEEIPFQIKKLEGFKSVYIPRVAELEVSGGREKEIFMSQGIQSLLLVPMVLHKTLVGFIGFDSVRSQKSWPERVISLLMIVGDIIVNALERKRIEEELNRTKDELEHLVKERSTVLSMTTNRLKQETHRRMKLEADLLDVGQYIQSLVNSTMNVAPFRISASADDPANPKIVFASHSIGHFLGTNSLDPFSAWFEHIHSDDKERVAAALRCSILNGVPFNQTFRVHHAASREWRWVNAMAEPTFDPPVDVTSFNGFVIDVTGQKQSEGFLSALMNGNPESLMLLDASGTILAVNDVCARRLNRSPNHLIGTGLFSVFDHGVAEFLRCRIQEAAVLGKPVYFTDTTADRIWENTVHPIAGIDGTVEQVVVFSLDCTETRRAQEELHRSGQHLRKLSQQLLLIEESERKFLYRELHESLGQSLSAIKTSTERIARQAEAQSFNTIAPSLRHAVSLIEDAIAKATRLCVSLKPSLVEDLGALEAITRLCREFHEICPGIVIRQQADLKEHDIPDYLKINMFRTIQSLLIATAQSQRDGVFDLGLQRSGTELALTFSDHGGGLAAEREAVDADGPETCILTGLKKQVELLGGNLFIDSIPGQYAHLRAVWECFS